MGCEGHGFHRIRMDGANARVFKARPSPSKDPEWVTRYREWWNGCIDKERKARQSKAT